MQNQSFTVPELVSGGAFLAWCYCWAHIILTFKNGLVNKMRCVIRAELGLISRNTELESDPAEERNNI